MNEYELREIEIQLGLSIPLEYRSFLLNFPRELVFEDAVDGDDWNWDHPDYGVFHTVQSFIKETQDARNFWSSGLFKRFSKKLLVVGNNGGGDYYCVKSGTKGDKVFLFDHERGRINRKETLPIAEYAQLWIDVKEGRRL